MEELKICIFCGPVHVHSIHFNWTGEMSDMEMALPILMLVYINAFWMQI